MKRNYDNIMWGVLLIIFAVYLLFTKLGIMEGNIIAGASIFELLLGIVFVYVLIKGIVKRSFGEIFFSIAILGIIFDEQLEITAITPWTILFVAGLLTVAMNLIFPHEYKKQHKQGHMHHNTFSSNTENVNGEKLMFNVVFGESAKYITSENFLQADCSSAFGELAVYFDNAIIQGDSAVVNLSVKFGQMTLYIPKMWRVENHVSATFGDVNEKGHANYGENAKVLYLNGSVNFGELEIVYM